MSMDCNYVRPTHPLAPSACTHKSSGGRKAEKGRTEGSDERTEGKMRDEMEGKMVGGWIA